MTHPLDAPQNLGENPSTPAPDAYQNVTLSERSCGSATEGPRAGPSVACRLITDASRAAYLGTTIFSLGELGIALVAGSRTAIWSPEAWNGTSVYSV